MFDQMKALNEVRKIQKELKKVEVEADAGNGAVVIIMNGEQKVTSVKLDPDKFDIEDIGRLEKLIESAVNQANSTLQKEVAERMKGKMGGLNLPGM
ncbi:YbaB/EbfC family nucleoid-associated protein [Candidatus Saccharibacteria bacterium]|nr:YbaB/EbfC family nucleoid-associated protein [Candidatus Saccharibacteria bacterium]